MQATMRFFICLMTIPFLGSGCRKHAETVQVNLLVQLIANGQWVITKYIKGSTNVTADFSPYSFQFKTDYTVEAINNSTVETTGTWNGSIATRTITSNFPNPNPILSLLNGTWLVTDSDFDYVEAKQTVNSETRFLRLVKK